MVQQGTAGVDLIFLNAAAGPQISDLCQSGGDAPLLGGGRYRRTAPCCSLQLKWDHLWRVERLPERLSEQNKIDKQLLQIYSPFPISIRWDSYCDRGSSLTTPTEGKKKRKNTDTCTVPLRGCKGGKYIVHSSPINRLYHNDKSVSPAPALTGFVAHHMRPSCCLVLHAQIVKHSNKTLTE